MVTVIQGGKVPLNVAQIKARSSWQYRVIEMMHGNQTQIGAVVIAILGKAKTHGPPRFGHQAAITSDGFIVAPFEGRDRNMTLAKVGHVNEITKQLREIADVLKLEDNERKELFSELRKWIIYDERSEPSILQ